MVQALIDYLRQNVWLVLLVVVASVVISTGVAALILLRLPHDHFRLSETSGLRRVRLAGRPSILRTLARVGKNLIGIALVLVGIVLSLPGVPGQGLLTIFAGLLLTDFPGKQRFERRVISHPPVLAAVNRLRAKFGRPALEL